MFKYTVHCTALLGCMDFSTVHCKPVFVSLSLCPLSPNKASRIIKEGQRVGELKREFNRESLREGSGGSSRERAHERAHERARERA